MLAQGPLTLSLSPRGERTAGTSAAASSGVPSPLGEKDRMRGDFAKYSTGFGITLHGPVKPGDDMSGLRRKFD